MKRVSAILLALMLAIPVATYFLDARWSLSILQVGVFGLSLVWLLSQWKLSVALAWRCAPLALLALLPALQLALGIPVYRFPTWEGLLTAATNLVLFLLACQVLDQARIRQPFLQALAIFGFLVSLVAILQLFTSGGKVYWLFPVEYPDALMGPFLNRNQYAAYIELMLPIALLCALKDARYRLAWAGVAATMYASVIASASRAGSVLVSAEVAVVLFLAFRREMLERRTLQIVVAVVLAFTALFTSIVGWDHLAQRLEKKDPFETRRDLTDASISMVQARPLLGFGMGNWATVYPRFARVDDGRYANQAHNDWLQTSAEGGFVALAALLAFAAGLLRPAFKSLWGIGVVAMLIHGLVDYPLQKPILMAWLMVLAAAMWTAERRA